MVKFNFSYKGKKFDLDVKECISFFQKMSGLMFRKKSKPLLFIWNKKTNEPIHSFFCVPFIAIWFFQGKIIEIKYVKPWKTYVKPRLDFDKLLEIPSNYSDFSRFKLLITK